MVLCTVDQGGSRDVVPEASVLQPPATVSSHSLAWLDPFDARLEMGASWRRCAVASCQTKSVRCNQRGLTPWGLNKSQFSSQNPDDDDDDDVGDDDDDDDDDFFVGYQRAHVRTSNESKLRGAAGWSEHFTSIQALHEHSQESVMSKQRAPLAALQRPLSRTSTASRALRRALRHCLNFLSTCRRQQDSTDFLRHPFEGTDLAQKLSSGKQVSSKLRTSPDIASSATSSSAGSCPAFPCFAGPSGQVPFSWGFLGSAHLSRHPSHGKQ